MTTITVFSYVFSALLVSWFVLLYRYVQARREIRRLEEFEEMFRQLRHGNSSTTKAVNSLRDLGRSAASLFVEFIPEDVSSGIVYQDKDGDGTPDVFQRRKPLAEILEFEKDSVGHQNDYWVAIELPSRSPKKGEYFFCGNMIIKARHNYEAEVVIVKSVPGTNLDDLVELTK